MTPDTRPPCLIGLPYDASSSFLRGPAQAPPRIREALHSPAGNLWTEDLLDLGLPGALIDDGDLPSASAEDARSLIEKAIARIIADGHRPIALGGDHAVTHPILRGVNQHHAPPTILHVDAHPDLYEEFEGDRHSHACPFARILEEGLASRLVQVGIRTTNGHQRSQAERYGVEVITMKDWARGARPTVSGEVYLSVDLDGLDPAFTPGVSHREPGGLSTREVIGIIQGIPAPLIGADVVELNPTQDATDLTARVAAKLVKEIAGQMSRREV